MKTLAKSKIIGKIRQKTTQTATGNPGRGQKGSTIVAVMAALVFIGIVVAGMLKNTGSQSAASRGYGSAMEMSSTVSSGFVATEGFFLGDDVNKIKKGLAFIDTLVQTNGGSPTNKKFLFGGSANQGKRERLATSDQYFSSIAIPGSVQNLINKPDSCVRAGFLVAAGKNAKGKELRKGQTFLQFKNLKQFEQNGDVGATNAVFATGDLSDANAGMTVDSGGATFMSYVKFQNVPATFERKAYFGGGAYFMGDDTAWFKGKAYFASGTALTEFYKKAIFDSLVIFNGPVKFHKAAMFKQGAYFLKDVLFEGGADTLKGVAYFGSGVATFASSSPMTFQKEAYFMNGYTFNAATFNGVAYFNGTHTFEGNVTFNKKAFFNGGAIFTKITTFGITAPAYFNGGPITFDGSATTTFNNVAWFRQAVNIKADMTFNMWARFDGNVTFTDGGKGSFDGETYFGGALKLGTNNLNFYHRVGFDGSIDFNGTRTIKSNKDKVKPDTKYDVLINATFTNVGSGKIEGVNDQVSGKHEAWWSTPKFNNNAAVWKSALVNFNNPRAEPSINNGVLAEFKYLIGAKKKDDIVGNIVADTLSAPPIIPDPPTLPPADRDPQLDISRLYADTAYGVKILNAKQAMTTDNNTFNMAKLKETYENAILNPGTLYNRTHLVIEITSHITIPGNVVDQKYDANIIYIIKEGGKLDAGNGFYSNTSDTAKTSTLIYVGKGDATLQQFGTKNTFRGFIYIDSSNTSTNNTLMFKDGAQAKVIGAIHNFSSKKILWNTGGYSVPIVFSPKVINAFAKLYGDAGGTPSEDAKVELKVSGKGIDVKLLGVYFH